MTMYFSVRVSLTDSLGSALGPASEQTIILSVLVLKDAFGMFLFLHL